MDNALEGQGMKNWKGNWEEQCHLPVSKVIFRASFLELMRGLSGCLCLTSVAVITQY